jgi:glucan biosynthesis protein
VIVRRHAPLSGWRVLVDPRRSRAVDVDLRLHLASEDRRLSETWIHRWYLEE